MCWIGTHADAIGKIAEKDIIAYKVLYEEKMPISHKFLGYYSPYQEMEYKKGETYKQGIIPYSNSNYVNRYEIKQGLHLYSDECSIFITEFCSVFVVYANVKQYDETFGIYNQHCATYHCNYKNGSRTPCLAKCKIPAGTKYYINERGEIASEKIEVISIISTQFWTKKEKFKLNHFNNIL